MRLSLNARVRALSLSPPLSLGALSAVQITQTAVGRVKKCPPTKPPTLPCVSSHPGSCGCLAHDVCGMQAASMWTLVVVCIHSLICLGREQLNLSPSPSPAFGLEMEGGGCSEAAAGMGKIGSLSRRSPPFASLSCYQTIFCPSSTFSSPRARPLLPRNLRSIEFFRLHCSPSLLRSPREGLFTVSLPLKIVFSAGPVWLVFAGFRPLHLRVLLWRSVLHDL